MSTDELLKLKYIVISKQFDNGTASEYSTTDEGKEFLKKEFNKEEILKYIETFDKPELTYLYVTKNN